LSPEEAAGAGVASLSLDYCAAGQNTARVGGLLTPQERRTATLLARGLTNRQIAAELVITEGTTKLHVKHILQKLGFTSRAQIAGWAFQQGLAEISTTAAPV
jgi:DNA-binding NarL/FixJ family response regulator